MLPVLEVSRRTNWKYIIQNCPSCLSGYLTLVSATLLPALFRMLAVLLSSKAVKRSPILLIPLEMATKADLRYSWGKSRSNYECGCSFWSHRVLRTDFREGFSTGSQVSNEVGWGSGDLLGSDQLVARLLGPDKGGAGGQGGEQVSNLADSHNSLLSAGITSSRDVQTSLIIKLKI